MAEQTIPKSNLRPAGRRAFGGFLAKIITLIIIIAILGGGLYWIMGNSQGAIHNYPSNKWQAVFLSNGQIYFGHVTKITKDTLVLEDIYYLQVVTAPLQRSQDSPDSVNQQEQRLTLIKLGNEIHGPYDKMNINQNHVVLVENLKDDSRVVQAITKYILDQQ